ncbi:hypothetical protein CHS0354_026531 [Potamilus streckersoni]|uniref:Uncharacterized protein n=1 Tax=Potamilus streckersoni TaxID=2493646 RepID=A0AAE0VHY9_9BIVA|nr:hypothetical protein CHS0354_026531 [Potamilus streckersoni]
MKKLMMSSDLDITFELRTHYNVQNLGTESIGIIRAKKKDELNKQVPVPAHYVEGGYWEVFLVVPPFQKIYWKWVVFSKETAKIVRSEKETRKLRPPDKDSYMFVPWNGDERVVMPLFKTKIYVQNIDGNLSDLQVIDGAKDTDNVCDISGQNSEQSEKTFPEPVLLQEEIEDERVNGKITDTSSQHPIVQDIVQRVIKRASATLNQRASESFVKKMSDIVVKRASDAVIKRASDVVVKRTSDTIAKRSMFTKKAPRTDDPQSHMRNESVMDVLLNLPRQNKYVLLSIALPAIIMGIVIGVIICLVLPVRQ